MDSNLISGLLGAVIGGLFTLWGTLIEGRRQNKSQELAALEKRKHVLVGVRSEITTLLEIYRDRVYDKIEAHQDGNVFNIIFPITQNNFIFYEQNALALSCVSEATLRETVRFYGSAKSLVDSYKMNNDALRQIEEVATIAADSKNDVHRIRYEALYQMCIEVGKGLKEIHTETMKRYATCLSLIEDELREIAAKEK
ncbi:hypothetical protein SMETH2_19760 [Serratia marcescens]|nr:hypothetical protein [Serratia marcescens]BEN01845.1 hypothetical protein SMETH2_19760 [Serratia marcescens]